MKTVKGTRFHGGDAGKSLALAHASSEKDPKIAKMLKELADEK